MIRDVTLSFDNGPAAGVTEQVLAVLRQHGVAASFFVLGRHLQDPALRALAEQAHAAGHWIGNHTFTHELPLGDNPDPQAPQAEISTTQVLIGPLAHAQRWFRPFGRGGQVGPHLLSRAAADLLQQGRYSCVLWNAVPHDWDDPEGWVETALAQCRALPWALVVLHDRPSGAMDHLSSFIERARAEGARFRQDFPPDCVVLVQGRATPALAACTGA